MICIRRHMELPLHEHLSPDALERLREQTKKLYGNRHRLEVVVAVARTNEIFYLHEIAEVTGIADSPVRSILRDIVDAGLLKDLEGKRGSAKFYERLPSPYWTVAELVLESLIKVLAPPGVS
jgi:Fic family protein